MVSRETLTSRFVAGIFSIVGLSLTILLAQSVLILNPKQHLYAAAGTHRDPILTADHGFEQGVDCTASSYQVQPGDTITGLANQAKTTRESVRECNDLTSDTVYAGQILSLPGEVDKSHDETPRSRVTPPRRSAPPAMNGNYGYNNGNGRWHAGPSQRRRP